MSIFDDILAQDAQFAFCDSDGIGAEPVTYTRYPGGVAQTPISLNLVINRLLPQSMDEVDGRVRRVEIFVPRDTNNLKGVSACFEEDAITLPWRIGDTPEIYRVKQRATTDRGGWTVYAEWAQS